MSLNMLIETPEGLTTVARLTQNQRARPTGARHAPVQAASTPCLESVEGESKTVGEWLREWAKDGVAARDDEQHGQRGGR